jgi:hypothetical protein
MAFFKDSDSENKNTYINSLKQLEGWTSSCLNCHDQTYRLFLISNGCMEVLFSGLKRSKRERRPVSTFGVFLLPSRINPSDLIPFRINIEQWILQAVGRTLYAGNEPVARPLPTQGNMNAEEKQIDIHASKNPGSECFSRRRHFVP